MSLIGLSWKTSVFIRLWASLTRRSCSNLAELLQSVGRNTPSPLQICSNLPLQINFIYLIYLAEIPPTTFADLLKSATADLTLTLFIWYSTVLYMFDALNIVYRLLVLANLLYLTSFWGRATSFLEAMVDIKDPGFTLQHYFKDFGPTFHKLTLT